MRGMGPETKEHVMNAEADRWQSVALTRRLIVLPAQVRDVR
jgi:hypothetical protein